MTETEIKDLVWEVAADSAARGPGFAQEGVVLRRVRDILREKGESTTVQQLVLNTWHDLFSEKRLGWGYDLANPNSPFFHIRSH